MADKIKNHDFIELNYTGKLTDGTVFDTTIEKTAKEHHFFSENGKYGPVIICVGEKQILPGLDNAILNLEIGNKTEIKLSPENAFGKKDIKNLKIVPMEVFKKHKLNPYPGLQIDVDGMMGTVNRVSGGRIIVNFNHPLAGREIVYEVEIIRKITDAKEKIKAYLKATLRIPEEKIKVESHEKYFEAELPVNFPAQISEILSQKLTEIIEKEVKFSSKLEKKPENSAD